MKVTVIYPKGSLNEGNAQERIRFEDKVMEVELVPSDGMKIDYLKDMNAKSDLDICELIFRMFNRVDDSPLERYLEQYQVRSMMVGDFVVIEDKKYVCEDIGFKLVD